MSGQGGIVVKDLLPVFVGAVDGESSGGLFVPGRSHLEEHVRPGLVDGQVAHLVEDEDHHIGVATHPLLECFKPLSRLRVIEHLDGWHIQVAVASLASPLAQGDS
jgi:hypothetical protein